MGTKVIAMKLLHRGDISLSVDGIWRDSHISTYTLSTNVLKAKSESSVSSHDIKRSHQHTWASGTQRTKILLLQAPLYTRPQRLQRGKLVCDLFCPPKPEQWEAAQAGDAAEWERLYLFVGNMMLWTRPVA